MTAVAAITFVTVGLNSAMIVGMDILVLLTKIAANVIQDAVSPRVLAQINTSDYLNRNTADLGQMNGESVVT